MALYNCPADIQQTVAPRIVHLRNITFPKLSFDSKSIPSRFIPKSLPALGQAFAGEVKRHNRIIGSKHTTHTT